MLKVHKCQNVSANVHVGKELRQLAVLSDLKDKSLNHARYALMVSLTV